MQEFITSFFWNLGIEITSIEVSEKLEDFQIKIETPDSALLIGMHGKNLDSFQHLLGRMIEKKIGRFTRVHLEVNDYIKSKDDRLFHILEMKIALAQSIKKPVKVPDLTPYERKKAHDYISWKNIAGLSTRSEGEWTERILSIVYSWEPLSPKQQHTTNQKIHPIGEDLSEDGVGI